VIGYAPLANPTRNPTEPHKNILRNFVIKDIQDIRKKTRAQIVLAWNIQRSMFLFSHNFTAEKGITVIPKTTSYERAVENMGALNVALKKQDIEFINAIDRQERTYEPLTSAS
jgi:diketogulonate reductase-like aldo/keto reductase